MLTLVFLDDDYYKFILCLHALLPPTKMAKHNQKVWKFSIFDSQSYCISHELNIFNFEQNKKIAMNKNSDYGITTNVILGAIGETLELSKFHVTFDDITYVFGDIVTALECACKIHFVLDLEYQRQSYNFWFLLQELFFSDVPSKERCPSDVKTHATNLKALLN